MKLSQFLPASIALILCNSTLSAQNPGFAFELDSVTATPGQVVCVPMRAVGFQEIVSFQVSIEFDANVVTFDHAENFQLPDWDEDFFNDYTSQCLLTVWSSETGQPVSRQNGTTLVDLCFKVIAQPGTSSDLSLTSCFPPGNGGNEAHDYNYNDVWDPALFVNGRIDIVPEATLPAKSPQNIQAGVRLFPNPTSAGSTLQFQARQADTGALRVTNLYGNTVWEQPIAMVAGENAFQIPANALRNPGIYQVCITSGQEVLTQLLSTLKQ
ncbi:MAG: T9SS type A sorting domain-containing protein [Saprospiraceae bacterium]|nr:T9SS type A sorting domain-containing protein [Saprospiraceae bacterium]